MAPSTGCQSGFVRVWEVSNTPDPVQVTVMLPSAFLTMDPNSAGFAAGKAGSGTVRVR